MKMESEILMMKPREQSQLEPKDHNSEDGDEPDYQTFLAGIDLQKQLHPEMLSHSVSVDPRPTKEIAKFELFVAENLLVILEYLRAQISGAATQNNSEKRRVTEYFWKIRHYGLSADFYSSRCDIKYRCGTKFQENDIGRVYAYSTSLHARDVTKQIGLQNMPRWIRAALASQFYWDIDIINAHPSLFLGILDKLNVRDVTNLRILVLERGKILKELAALTGANTHDEGRSKAKQILTTLFYGGSIESI